MSIKVRIESKDSLKNEEVIYAMIEEIENLYKTSLINIKRFSSSLRIEALLIPLVNEHMIDLEFINFVEKEYGEPWVKGYPVDSVNLLEALCTWTSLDTEEVEKCLSHMIASLALTSTIIRDTIYFMFMENISSKNVELKPIEKKYRKLKFGKNLSENFSKEEIDKKSLDSILESTEAILALTDDELIKEQILNIQEKLGSRT